jgi:hypothetical protein
MPSARGRFRSLRSRELSLRRSRLDLFCWEHVRCVLHLGQRGESSIEYFGEVSYA